MLSVKHQKAIIRLQMLVFN